MKVLLTKDVQSLGESGDIVDVADGYARNYLLPKKLAEAATEGALKNREQNIARIKAKAEKLHQEALEQAEKIKALGQIDIHAKAGENGKLFGAITTRRLADEIKEKSGIEVDRRNISLNNPINHVGEYKMVVKLTSKVSVNISVVVAASEIIREEA
ncbi:MAG: 50S ribosomal protein L9 [Candidatus Melainabacteria bacterium RIFOXYA12_FULL_32_12]|nr:MAG: 50S ribosomal protein L9 [Candidatus Melainabacteria bacterium RIFOXYA2_FULL_32_9]OGI24286.1 MAG: 50S ribosomal protein L9 [Candidatus Melainabacteria bacterium RIFOXYA12_FULL_32_12]